MREADGQINVMYKTKDMLKSAGRCSPATPLSMALRWVIAEAEAGDVIITAEGKFVMPLKMPRQSEVAC